MTLSDDNVLTVNVAAQNAFDGFVVASSSRNEFSGNRATMNRFGFWVRKNPDLPDATHNVFTQNAGCRNEYWDALDEGVDTTWENNDFCMWSGL